MTLSASDQDELREPHKDPNLRSNPFELHWRSAGPKWKGNMDGAFRGKYPHMDDEIYCRYCGAIPCPIDYDDLTSTRLKDLEFVRDLVKEKKEIEAKYKQLHEQLKLSEKKKQEWDFERRMMETEMTRLRQMNDKHLNKLVNYRKDQHKLVELSERVKVLEAENEKLTSEAQKTRHALFSQMEDADRFEKENKRLKLELEEEEEKVRTLQGDLDGLSEERERHKQELANRDERIREVEEEMKAILMEFEVQTKVFTEKENMSKSLIEELKKHMTDLRNKLEASERYSSDLEEQINEYLIEIEKLKYKLANDKRFKKFVAIKRECNELKNQNEALLHRSHFGHAHSIPILNAEGRVTSPTGKITTGMLQIRRAKSASVFTSRERIYAVRKIRDTLKLENLD